MTKNHFGASKINENYLYNVQGLTLFVEGQDFNPCILNRVHTNFDDNISKDAYHNFY